MKIKLVIEGIKKIENNNYAIFNFMHLNIVLNFFWFK